jgi:hypothetical protein
VVDLDTPCIEHPVFVVENYKFAPVLAQLIRLYSQLDGSLATHIAKSASEAVTDALNPTATYLHYQHYHTDEPFSVERRSQPLPLTSS